MSRPTRRNFANVSPNSAAIGALSLGLAALPACGDAFSNCQDTRSCPSDPGSDSGAPGGAGGSGTEATGGSSGASMAEGGGGAGADDGGAGQTQASAGAPCEQTGELACAGAAQKLVLMCDGTSWRVHETCAREQNCDTLSPSCATIVAACDGHEPGYSVCLDNEVVTCGPDLVTVEREPCEGLCVDATCQAPRCGDARVQGSLEETCDDANAIDTDACPSTCHAATCGDGFVRAGVEACDDGNDADTDGCLSSCEVATCGDGFTNASVEACDDGNDVDTDACLNGCEAPSCGDGTVWDGQEACEPGVSPDCRGVCRWIWDPVEHSCALQRTTGTVKCWGKNESGRLGLGIKESAYAEGDAAGEMGANLPAIDLGSSRTATHLSARFDHTCAVLDDSTLKCWGFNGAGQLGLGHIETMGDDLLEMGDSLLPIDLGTAPAQPIRTALGSAHTCVLFNTGEIKCFGHNAYGQLGLGHKDTKGTLPEHMGDNLPFVDVSIYDVTQVVANGNFTCALTATGAVRCWGENGAGQIGMGNTTDQTSPVTVDLGANVEVQALAAGYEFACALLTDGSVKCWGGNYSGQLGQGDGNDRGDGLNELGSNLDPIDLGTGEKATMVTTGLWHACALLERGAVKCWGGNEGGQLGFGFAVADWGKSAGQMGDLLPVVDLGGQKALRITAFDYSTCALLEDGSLRCWGANDFGILGIGDTAMRGRLTADMGENLPEVHLD